MGIELQIKSSTEATAVVRSLRDFDPILKPITISHFGKKRGFDLTIPDLFDSPVSLTRVDLGSKTEMGSVNKKCYVGQSQDEYRVEFCWNQELFTLLVTQRKTPKLSLSGTEFGRQGRIVYETPRTLTLSQAIDLALQKNGAILEEQQILVQAQNEARRAYLNLLPHLNFSSVLPIGMIAAGVGYPAQAIGSVGNFVPFVFPGKWLFAKEKDWQYRAQRVADILLKANTAASVQTLVISLLAHREQLEELRAVYGFLWMAYEQVKKLQSRSAVSSGAARSAKIAIDDLLFLLFQTQRALIADVQALAGIFGFASTSAIQDIIPDKYIAKIDQLEMLNSDALEKSKTNYAELAVLNSFEIRQQMFLKEAALLDQKSVFVNWFDPSNSNSFLGFNLFAEYQEAGSVVGAIDLKMGRIRSELVRSARSTVADLNENLEIFEAAKESMKIRRDNLMQTVMLLLFEESPDQKSIFDASRFRKSVQDLVDGMKEYYGARTAALMDQAMLERIALQGVYGRLLPYLEEEQQDVRPG